MNFFVTLLFEAVALSSDLSPVSDKTFSGKSIRFFFLSRQEWLVLGLSLLIKMIIGASFKIFKERWTTRSTKTFNNRFYNFKKI